MSRLFDSIGHPNLFDCSETLGQIGFRVSGNSDTNVLYPLTWRLSSLGDERKAEIHFLPNLKDVYGDIHPIFDRVVDVGVTYTPATKTWTKNVQFSKNFGLEFNAVSGGPIVKNVKAEFNHDQLVGPFHCGIDINVPLDSTAKTETSGQLKIDWKNYFVATSHSNVISCGEKPELKAGYEDNLFSAILGTKDYTNFELTVTKGTDANTIVGVHADLSKGDYQIGFEHVLSDNSEVKIGVNNTDLLNLQYVKQFPGITATIAAQTSKFITTGQPENLKVGLGIEIEL